MLQNVIDMVQIYLNSLKIRLRRTKYDYIESNYNSRNL